MVSREGRWTRSLGVLCASLALTAAVAVAVSGGPSLAQDEAQSRAGVEAWKKGKCANCHGSFADGDKLMDKAPEGANLRKTTLDRAQLIEFTRCGLPGTEMPAHDPGAYTVNECYGIVGEDVEKRTGKDLSPEEIEAMVDYLLARVVGAGRITREECTFYYGNPAKCLTYRPADD